MASGEELTVYNVAWGRDVGDIWEHLTVNFSPDDRGQDMEFFFMSAVVSIVDPETGEILAAQDPNPGER